MPRLSIDITPEEHQKLKAIAALKGQSIKEFVLKRTLGDAPTLDAMSEEEAFSALAEFLKPRIDQARRGSCPRSRLPTSVARPVSKRDDSTSDEKLRPYPRGGRGFAGHLGIQL